MTAAADAAAPVEITFVHNVKAQLALHHLRSGPGRPLLLLHGLAEQSPAAVPAHLDGWSGPVIGLDFTGHGRSTVPSGGGYTSEVLMADVDAALAEIGPATVLVMGFPFDDGQRAHVIDAVIETMLVGLGAPSRVATT